MALERSFATPEENSFVLTINDPVFTGNIANQIDNSGEAVLLDISGNWTNSPTSFVVTSGSLPSGLTLSNGGIISGSHVGDEVQAGIIITGSSVFGSDVSNAFSWAIEAVSDLVTVFRSAMKQFTNSTIWPADVIEDAMCEADPETGGSGWGVLDLTDCQNFKRRGMFLYAAHWLVTSYPNGADDESSVDGGVNNTIASKSVADESVSFATVANLSAGDNWLSSTRYGQQWMRLRKRAGMGARTTGANARPVRRGGFISTGLC